MRVLALKTIRMLVEVVGADGKGEKSYSDVRLVDGRA